MAVEVGENSGRRGARGVPVMIAVGTLVFLAGGGLLLTGVLAARERPTGQVSVGLEVPITAMDRTVAPANNSPVLLADPTEARFVVLANRQDAPDFSCALSVSGDGGRGWAPVNPVPKLPAGVEKCYAPEVAFDGRGRLYYLFAGLAGGGNEPAGVFLTSSVDRGRTFTPPRQVLGPHNFSVRMAVDQTVGEVGRIHLVWVKATSDPPLGGFGPPPNPILAAHSDDGGRTFSKPVAVSDRERQRVVAPALALGPDGAVHVAYYDLQDDVIDYQGLEGTTWEGHWELVVASSRDDGRRFGPSVVVEASIVPPGRVLLIFTMEPPALVAHRDRACVAWTDGRHGDADTLLRCSQDRGRTWSGARRLNDDKLRNGISQYMPRLSIAPNGRLDAIFYDRRVVPGNFANDVFYTYSVDGGRTFSANARVTSDGSDSRIGPQYAHAAAEGLVEFGSRLALLSRSDDALAAWGDTRNSLPLTWGQDVFLAPVTPPASPDRGGATSGGTALAGAGAALVGAGVWRRRSLSATTVVP